MVKTALGNIHSMWKAGEEHPEKVGRGWRETWEVQELVRSK